MFVLFLIMARFRILSISCICLFLLPVCGIAGQEYFKFLKATTIQLADSNTAAAFLGSNDGYPELFSEFDLQSRLGKDKPYKPADYLAFAAKQTRNWNTEERATIEEGFRTIEAFATAHQLHLVLPDTVLFIKSTCREEFEAAGYTRKHGIIIKAGEELSAGLIAHELFHVLSRHNPKLRDKLYENIGFKKCNVIDVRSAMSGLNITNPDCPVISHYVTVNGKDMTLVLHSKKVYEGGKIFEDDYINISLLALKGDDAHKKPETNDGKTVLYSLEEKMELFSIVGMITPYVLHPEEICAEHFVSLVMEKEVEEPHFIDKMKTVLQQ